MRSPFAEVWERQGGGGNGEGGAGSGGSGAGSGGGSGHEGGGQVDGRAGLAPAGSASAQGNPGPLDGERLRLEPLAAMAGLVIRRMVAAAEAAVVEIAGMQARQGFHEALGRALLLEQAGPGQAVPGAEGEGGQAEAGQGPSPG